VKYSIQILLIAIIFFSFSTLELHLFFTSSSLRQRLQLGLAQCLPGSSGTGGAIQ
jgi:hypothetical protein